METVLAIGLASNVVQFVDFTSKLVHTYNQLRHDAAQSEHEYHRQVTTHLLPIADKIRVSAHDVAQSSNTTSLERKALQAVADGCCELADKLLKRLDSYIVQYGQAGTRTFMRRARTALKIIWERSEIDEMMNQLEYFRSELNLHLTFEVRQVLQKNQTLQLTKDDVRAVLDKISQLESSLADIRLHFNNDSKTRQTEVLHAVSTLVAENSVLHARSTQRSIESHAAITGGMDSLKQMVHTQHLESMDYLARAEVKNTQFFATMTVERASLEDSIENVLRPLLEEYRDSLLQETRKEFRGTARAQIEELLTGLTRNMDLQDCSHLKDRFSYSPEHEEQQSCYATMSTDLMPSQLQPCGINNDESEKIKKHKDRKAGWALLYKHWLEKKTRIGTFLLLVRHTTQLRTGQPPLSVFALEAHFVPNLFWLSTGRSIMYQRIQDGRGSPKFGFQFPVYRVLGSDHEVWGSIYLGNLDAVQAMLSQKSILPSDRDEAGWTLLHYAVLRNRVDIVKALLQSGAEVNAKDSKGYSPIMMAISPHNFGSTGQKDNIFHFLRGLSDVDYGDLWEPELPYYFFAELLTTQEFHKDISNIISDAIPDCLRTCRALEIDIGPPNGANFGRMLIESFVIFFSCPNTRGYFGSGHDDSVAFLSNIYARAIGIFDASVTRAPGYESLQMSQNIPVAYSASELWLQVHEGWNSRLLGHQRSSSNWVFYHGFYVDPRLVFSLRFLEHVISTGIKQRPDCIFDSDCNRTTLDWLMNVRYEGVLALLLDDILVEHGIDPEWALAENERRKRVVTGDTSAHEVNIGVDVSKIQEVTKRRAFRSTEDD